MTTYVVDASVAVKWFVDEVHSELARKLIGLDVDRRAPDFLLVEVANTMLKKVRAGDVAAANARGALSRVGRSVQLAPTAELVPTALELAMEHGRSIYDSLYVALAVREGCRLVTADRRLYNAVSPLLAETMLWIEELAGE